MQSARVSRAPSILEQEQELGRYGPARHPGKPKAGGGPGRSDRTGDQKRHVRLPKMVSRGQPSRSIQAQGRTTEDDRPILSTMDPPKDASDCTARTRKRLSRPFQDLYTAKTRKYRYSGSHTGVTRGFPELSLARI